MSCSRYDDLVHEDLIGESDLLNSCGQFFFPWELGLGLVVCDAGNICVDKMKTVTDRPFPRLNLCNLSTTGVKCVSANNYIEYVFVSVCW